MSDLVGNPEDRFSRDKMKNEPHREKTEFLPRRKQRRRSV